jgi:hypothetical protein
MTPKPLLEDGYSFYFFSNENNEPPHVHVSKGGGKAKWWLTPGTTREILIRLQAR